MTEPFTKALRLNPRLTDLIDDLDVIEIKLAANGSVHARRRGGRRAQQLIVERETVAKLFQALDDAHRMSQSTGPVVLELGAFRWIKIDGPMSRDELIFGLRVRPPRATTSELVREGFISRQAIRLIEGALRSQRGVVLAGPPSSGKTRLLTSLLSGLRASDGHVIVLEGHIELDLDGLDVTSLRRATLPTAPPHRQIFADLIQRADILVADQLTHQDDWTWLHPQHPTQERPQSLLLALRADSADNALAMLMELALKPDEETVHLDKAGLELLVLCGHDDAGRPTVHELVHIPSGPLRLDTPPTLRAAVGDTPRSTASTPPEPAPESSQEQTTPPESDAPSPTEAEPPKLADTPTPNALNTDPSDEATTQTPEPEPPPIETTAATSKPSEFEASNPPTTEPEPEPPEDKPSAADDALEDHDTGPKDEDEAVAAQTELDPAPLKATPAEAPPKLPRTPQGSQDVIGRLQRRLQQTEQLEVDKLRNPPLQSTELLDVAKLRAEYDSTSSQETSPPEDGKPRGRSRRQATRPMEAFTPEAPEPAKPDEPNTPEAAFDDASAQEPDETTSQPSRRSSLRLSAMRSGRRTLSGTLERKKPDEPEPPAEPTPEPARQSRANSRSFSRVLDRRSRSRDHQDTGDTASSEPQPELSDSDQQDDRAAAWAMRRQVYAGDEASSHKPPAQGSVRHPADEDATTIMRDSRKLAAPRLSELGDDDDLDGLFLDEDDSTDAVDADSTTEMTRDMVNRALPRYRELGDYDKTMPRGPRRKK